MSFENLFNGNYAFSQTTKKFLNDNWREILNEVKPLVTKAVAAVYKAIAGPIFIKHPYKDLFLPDDGDVDDDDKT